MHIEWLDTETSEYTYVCLTHNHQAILINNLIKLRTLYIAVFSERKLKFHRSGVILV